MGKETEETNERKGFGSLARDNELEVRYEEYKNDIMNLTLMSDVFMRNVFKKQECTEYVLQVIMGRKDMKVKEQVLQKDYKNLQGRSAILDCVARDSENKMYNVEIQQKEEGAAPKRARYHSGLLDMNTLREGQDFEELPESYVIFITKDDVLGYGLPIYHIYKGIAEVKEKFQDDAHIIYVNSRVQDDTELGRLMHDFHCKNADDMHSQILAERVRELKETPEGVESMCDIMDKIYDRGMARGEKRGEKRGVKIGEMKTKRETALSLAEIGLTIEQIVYVVKESKALVEKWLDEGLSATK